MQEGKVEALQIAEERREVKGKVKGKMHPAECTVPEKSKEIRPSYMNSAEK